MTSENTNPELKAELADLRARLAEAEETLRAIIAGEVEAVVIAGNQGDEVHLLGAGDRIYRQFIETASEGTATVSAAGEILCCNDCLAKTLRRPIDHVLGTAMRDHVSPDDHEAFRAILAQTGSESSRRKIRLITCAGALVPVYLSATLLHSAGAAPVFCLVLTDLEEVISTETTLRESEEEFRATFEQAAVGFAHATPDGHWLRVNQKLADIVGYTREELLTKTFREITHPDDLGMDLAFLRQTLAGAISSFSIEKRYIRKDTSVVWVNVTVSLVRKPSGEPNYFIGVIEDIMRRKQAEELLRREHDRAQGYLDTVETIIVAMDSEGRITSVNRKGSDLLGWSEKELLGRLWFATCLPQPDGMEQVYPTFLRLMAGETAALEYFENPIVTKGGVQRQIAWHNALLRDERGGITGVLSSGEDITERRRAEDALRASKQLTEGIINAIPVRVFWKDKDLVYLGCNAAFARDAGFADAEDLIGKDDFQLGWKDQAELYRNDDRQVMESGDSKLLIEAPQTTPDGKTITLLTSKLPLRNGAGAIIGVLGTYIDITERKRAEADRERLSVAIEQTAEIVMVTDAEGTIQYVNPIFETVTGYTRAEAVGQNSRLLKSGEQDEDFYRGLRETIAAGLVWSGRLVNRKKDGSLYTEDTTISPVHDEVGRIVSYVAVKRDVTEQLRLAEEKTRLEDQLRQAQKVEAIGRLAGGVAHDFNNMMAIILGYGEMLLGQLRPEDPARNWAEQIMEAGRRSASLTRQLLAFSRKQTLLPEVLDLNALLRNLEKMFGRLIKENIELEFKLAGDLAHAKADPGQIEQVITNLVLNARDAMPLGGKLTVETANVELDQMYALGHESVLPGAYVMLAVTDTGCGIDKATMARLFEPFFTTKEKGKGTGLGLATAYGIVKQSGGYIWAYSEPGQGTSFKIYLPRTDAALAAKVVEAGGEAPRGSGERILLVEDETVLRELCETILVRLGYRVNAAGNGHKALLLVQGQSLEPDLVITDVIMPVMGGAEMTERLRRDRPNLRVLYMSGYPDDTIASHGVLESGTPFLQKPFTERALAVKVREALGGKTVGEKPAAARLGSVLMIDDDEQYRELVRHFCMKRGHVFAGVGDSAAAIAALAGQHFDVLLVDKNIPGTSGEHILQEIRAAGHATPAIVLTGDVASADMDVLRPLGVVQALEKSSNAEPLLQAIEAAGSTSRG